MKMKIVTLPISIQYLQLDPWQIINLAHLQGALFPTNEDEHQS